MSAYRVEPDIHGGVVVYAEERAAVLNSVMDVCTAVAPTVLVNICHAVAEYHESAGQSAASALDAALMDVPDRIAISLLKVTPEEAVALGAALQFEGMRLMGGDAA